MNLVHRVEDKKSHLGIGGKAKNLVHLEEIGAKVPSWAVVPEEVLLKQLAQELGVDQIQDAFNKLLVPQDIIAQLQLFFGENFEATTYAVRSSAIDEDGAQFSFAGQFETYLHVSHDEIEEKIKAIWLSAVSPRVIKYRQQNNLPLQFGIGVIIQEMISSEAAGVAFGADPLTGDPSIKIVSAVFGLGEGLVSGDLDADTFTISEQGIKSQVVSKPHQYVRDTVNGGIEKTETNASIKDTPSLSEQQVYEISTLLDQLNHKLGKAQDLEFAFSKGLLYLLQTRPITTVEKFQKGEYILWDNSNIIESYPGITTPLTFTFIIKMYEMVYRQFVEMMGVKPKELEKHASIFANTLGLVRGRVYYNLLNWYKMLAMVPGYSINAENMERMMGVKERFELGGEFQMSKGLARLRIAGMVFNMIQMQFFLPKTRRKFLKQLNQIMTKYKSIDFSKKTSAQIIEHYITFESSLLLRWKAPLVNDFFAMIWFGMLEKKAKQYCPNEPNIHNDLLCGSQDIISVEPIHRSIELSILVSKNSDSKKMFLENTPLEIWNRLTDGAFPEVKKGITDYIQRFGDRCVGELKLETVSYSQKPELFVKVVQSYVKQGIITKRSSSNIENDLRANAEEKIFKQLKGKTLKKWWFKFIIAQTRDLVSSRENLRFERTRGFGMVRNMFSALGQIWHQEGHLENPRDIFYLELDEIKSMANGKFNSALIEPLKERIVEFDRYKKQIPPQERFSTYGNDFKDEYIYSLEKIEAAEDGLSGIGCCPGIVQGKVQVVMDPNEIDSLNGDILVTSSTDPGWVTLFPTASAIIVERGSLLSHSAIVSREMGIPCIVSVSGLLRTLKSGDEILMDGSTGNIKIIENE
jgi:phosphoenolpyruvate synthase/pyruvate phosphate dikinase